MTVNKNIPKHWQVKRFEDLLDYLQPTPFIVDSTEYSSDYKTPVLTAGKTFILGHTNESQGIFNSLPVIIFDDFTTANRLVNFPFKVKSSAMKILKPKDESMNLKFVFYYMQTVKITFDTHKRYWISVFSKLPISLPPLPEQRAIVSKIEELLSDLDNGKQQLLTAQQQLKVYRQSLLKAAFEGKLTAGWRESHKQGNSNSLALAAEPEENYGENGKLPEGWKILNLKSICHIVGGVTKGKDYKGRQTISLPYLRVANVQDGYLDLKEIKKIEVLPSDLDKYRLISGDILYTEGGDKDKLGRGTIWKNEIPDCIHQNHIFRARPFSKNINPRYIAYYSQTKSAKSYFFKHGKQTTNLASINLTILSGLPLPICSTEEQQLLIDELESKLTIYDKMEETISQSLLQAETLRQSILKRAFEGRLV